MKRNLMMTNGVQPRMDRKPVQSGLAQDRKMNKSKTLLTPHDVEWVTIRRKHEVMRAIPEKRGGSRD